MLVIPTSAHSGSTDIYCKQNFSYSHTSRSLVCGSGGGGGGSFGTETIPAVGPDPANDVFTTIQINDADGSGLQNVIVNRLLASTTADLRVTLSLGGNENANELEVDGTSGASISNGQANHNALIALLTPGTVIRGGDGTAGRPFRYGMVNSFRTTNGTTVMEIDAFTGEIDGVATTTAQQMSTDTTAATSWNDGANAGSVPPATNTIAYRTALQGSTSTGSPERTVVHSALGTWTSLSSTGDDDDLRGDTGAFRFVSGQSYRFTIDNNDGDSRLEALLHLADGDMVQFSRPGETPETLEVASTVHSINADGIVLVTLTFDAALGHTLAAGDEYTLTLTNRVINLGGGGGGGSVTTTLTEDAGNVLLSKLNEIARGDHVNLGG